MKKLYKFKKWLSLDEASLYLTAILEETVKPADILQLALDKHLTLSLNFLENIPTRPARLIEYSPEHTISNNEKNDFESFSIDVDYNKLELLNGILDLPIIFGSSLLIKEKHRELLTGSVESTKFFKDILIEDQGNLYLICHYVMNPTFTEVKDLDFDSRRKYTNYHQIPNGTEFVVKSSALNTFVSNFSDSNKQSSVKNMPPDERQERSYLNIIGAMLVIMQDKSLSEHQKSLFGNQSAIVATLETKFKGSYGTSKTNLDKKFAAANRSLKSE